MNRAAVAATVIALSYSAAYADDDGAQTQTTTAQTLVVVTPNAPVIVNNSGQSQQAPLSPPGAPQAAPAADAAPHNEDWSNVSHINGSIVPVGERNAYLNAYKKNNLQSDPIAWMFGAFQISGQHALSQNVAVSLELSAWNNDTFSHSGYQLAATLPIYFRRAFSGPFLEGGVVIHSEDMESYDDCYDCSYGSTTGTKTWAGPEVLFGWSWLFDSGLNVSAAFGAVKRIGDNGDSYASRSPDPAGYFRVGYAF